MSRRGAFRMYLFVRVRYTDFSIGGVGNVAYICVSDLCPGIGGVHAGFVGKIIGGPQRPPTISLICSRLRSFGRCFRN